MRKMVILALLVFGLAALPARAQNLTVTNVSENEGQSDYPIMALDADGFLQVVWWDRSLNPNGELMNRQLRPDGTWTDIQRVTEDIDLVFTNSWHLARRPDGSLCLIFQGAADESNNDTIGVYRKCQRGPGWSEPEQLNRTAFTNKRDYQPAFDFDSSMPMVNLVNAGNVMFNDALDLSDGVFLGTFPFFVIDTDGVYHVIFVRQGNPYSVEHRYSTDRGQSWSAPERLSDDAFLGRGTTVGPASLVADAFGGVHMAYYAGRGFQYRKWTAETGWSAAVTIMLTDSASAARNMSTSLGLAVGPDGLAHLVWHGPAMWYARQLPEGGWTRPYQLAEGVGVGSGPALVIGADGRAHLVWKTSDGRKDIFYAGFNSSDYSTPSGVVEPSEAERAFNEMRRVVVGNTTLYETPDSASKIVGTAGPVDGEIAVLGSDPSGLWLKVERLNITGWMPAMATERLLPAVTVESLDVIVPQNSLSLPGLFDLPDPAALLGAAKPGDTFTATGRTEAGDWLQVRTADGKIVWMGAATVQPVEAGADFMALPVVTP
ncbi:MAG: hypothetical protein HXY41_02535 [Chloroflexi bacterium]|nr:hypothetical protein [Chloroflexota bacterium]